MFKKLQIQSITKIENSNFYKITAQNNYTLLINQIQLMVPIEYKTFYYNNCTYPCTLYVYKINENNLSDSFLCQLNITNVSEEQYVKETLDFLRKSDRKKYKNFKILLAMSYMKPNTLIRKQVPSLMKYNIDYKELWQAFCINFIYSHLNIDNTKIIRKIATEPLGLLEEW